MGSLKKEETHYCGIEAGINKKEDIKGSQKNLDDVDDDKIIVKGMIPADEHGQ